MKKKGCLSKLCNNNIEAISFKKETKKEKGTKFSANQIQ